jgi:hypothetical protein
MAVVHYVSKITPLPGGGRLIRGLLNFCSNYTAAGDPLNLANYFKSASSPTVVCSTADGFAIEHNQGTAAAGTLVAYQNSLTAATINGVAANAALVQVHSNADLSATNVVFFATGQHRL